MAHAELRQKLGVILREEESHDAHWSRVAALCGELSERLHTEFETDYPDAVWHYVDDADIREKDQRYAAWQRDLIWEYVNTGAMVEHAPSVRVPWWGCVIAVLAVIGIVIWLVGN